MTRSHLLADEALRPPDETTTSVMSSATGACTDEANEEFVRSWDSVFDKAEEQIRSDFASVSLLC